MVWKQRLAVLRTRLGLMDGLETTSEGPQPRHSVLSCYQTGQTQHSRLRQQNSDEIKREVFRFFTFSKLASVTRLHCWFGAQTLEVFTHSVHV